MRGCKKTEPASLQWYPVQVQKAASLHFNRRNLLFYRNGGQTLEQVPQRGSAASIRGDSQIPAGHMPTQAAVSEPALSTEQD